ncbi:hypothetical protein [Streptomyces flaveolus]|uniref:hypothetical protein n=1 Tax=Streptomyces flaveolus TaxID=67297 RepID=UPI0037FD6715
MAWVRPHPVRQPAAGVREPSTAPAATLVLFLVLFAGTDALYFTLTTFSTVSMLPMAGGLLLVRVAARVPAGTVQAGLHRKRREAPPHPQSGTGHPEPEARS